MDHTVNIGLLGCGNVGAALVELLAERSDDIAARSGIRLVITRIAVRSLSKQRTVELDENLLTTDASSVVADPDVDLIVEAMGGIEPTRELIETALKSHKPVVSANKELLANFGVDLYRTADDAGVDLLFEAAVAGGIPIMRPLRESLLGEDITRVMGIVNGTTNYILTRMTDDGWTYAESLVEAQTLGYAERDPTADVEGLDAGAKAAIIATIAFGVKVVAGDVYHEGISRLTQTDIDFARRLGFVIKLLAIAERFDDGTIAVRVHPAMVPTAHPLAAVRDSFNAVFVQGASVGDLMFYGRGAGGFPTASAVLGDVIDAASNAAKGTHATIGDFGAADICSVDELVSPYYINLQVNDRTGVLATVAGVFGAHGVSIQSMEQELIDTDELSADVDAARIIFITHEAREADVWATLQELKLLDAVNDVGTVLRVVGSE